jgi:CRP-like cAMP-binding protein
MTREEKASATALFERLPLFSGCTRRELKRLVSGSRPVTFQSGERLCVAGGESKEAYVVAAGRAAVTVGSIKVDEVGPVDVVGERGPISGRPRAATVTAVTDLRAYAISRQQLHDLMATSPTAAAAMRDEVLRRYG